VTAPDALVYINGETEIIGCPSCKRRFDIHKYLTSIQVDLNVDSPPGSANLSLVIPRHSIDDFYFEGIPVIQPMMEVEIYAKGYFLVEGMPQYYPIFWGLITEVDDAYSGGEHTVSINCADILKWWELCRMNVNPAFTAPSGQQGRNIFGNVFSGQNPYDVIWQLAQQAMGDVVVGTGSLTAFSGEVNQQKTFSNALGDIMSYWEERFSRVRSNLLLYGTAGVAVRGDTLYEAWNPKKGMSGAHFCSSAVRRANGGPESGQLVYDTTDPSVVAVKTQFNNAGQINLWQSEYQTKLELANAAKECIGYEFYMDVTGDIVFKPPFYNLDTLANKPVSWIQDIDIIDWNFSESEAEVVTQVQMSGSYGGNIDYSMPADVEPFTCVTDYHLLRKYGWRMKPVNSEFLGDPVLMFYHGMDILDRENAKRHRGSVSIPLRPELRLGFPVYLAPKDQMWYLSGISHNIQFGGRAQTTLTLTARRTKFFAPRGIGKLELTKCEGKGTPTSKFPYSSRQLAKGGQFKITVGEAAQMPADPNLFESAANSPDTNPFMPLILRHPKTGRAVGYPNVVMAYTRPFAPPKETLAKNTGATSTKKPNPQAEKKKKEEAKGRYAKEEQDTADALEANLNDALRSKYMGNRYQYGLTSAGVFTYLYDTKHIIGEVLLAPGLNFTVLPKDSTVKLPTSKGQSAMIRPVSDERGFEVIGHFRYGRGIQLRDGSLILDDPSQSAKVDVQQALTGDLYATLSAQSSGITTLASSYSNPAAALANLQPEDLQSAGIQNPDTKEPEFVNTEDNFVDGGAVIGSPQKEGFFASVEASQLSHALTLAEMTVKMDGGTGTDTCGCLMGRQDLAFLNSGFQVALSDPVNATTPDGSNLFNTRSFSTVPTKTADGTPILPSVFNAENPVAFIGGSSSLGKAQGTDAGSKGAKPVAASEAFPVGKPEDVAQKVNDILYRLYSILDQPHQEWEAALRGQNVSDARSAEDVRFGEPSPPATGALTPPFSAPDRFAVGDPAAIAQMAESNKAGLSQSWKDFGKKLSKTVDETKLQGEINILSSQVSSLSRDLSVLNPNAGDYAEKAAAINKKIADAQQQIQDKSLKLAEVRSR
jgi:hypothetical protein